MRGGIYSRAHLAGEATSTFEGSRGLKAPPTVDASTDNDAPVSALLPVLAETVDRRPGRVSCSRCAEVVLTRRCSRCLKKLSGGIPTEPSKTSSKEVTLDKDNRWF